MNILFKNIPIGVTGYQLAEFIESEFNVGCSEDNRVSITVCTIEMLEIQDHFCHPVEQFGAVRVPQPDLALQVINQLNGCFFNTLKITVREYFSRSSDNDPRLDVIAPPNGIIEKRVGDRREHPLIYSRLI